MAENVATSGRRGYIFFRAHAEDGRSEASWPQARCSGGRRRRGPQAAGSTPCAPAPAAPATPDAADPKPADAPSRLAITSRYVLSPTIFSALEKTTPGKNGELQLTDALARLVQSEPVFGWRYGGRRFDIGDKLGFVKTNIEFALRDPAIAADLHNYLRNLAG